MSQNLISLETDRLRLSAWREQDLPALRDMCSDPEVMRFFPKILDESEFIDLKHRMDEHFEFNGWGFFSVQLKATDECIGFVGLINLNPKFTFAPGVEIGWRLAKRFWRKGLATEAAQACLHFAFTTIGVDKVYALTTPQNEPSQKVMRRLGMENTYQNFLHPMLAADHALAEHVLYKIEKLDWEARTND